MDGEASDDGDDMYILLDLNGVEDHDQPKVGDRITLHDLNEGQPKVQLAHGPLLTARYEESIGSMLFFTYKADEVGAPRTAPAAQGTSARPASTSNPGANPAATKPPAPNPQAQFLSPPTPSAPLGVAGRAVKAEQERSKSGPVGVRTLGFGDSSGPGCAVPVQVEGQTIEISQGFGTKAQSLVGPELWPGGPSAASGSGRERRKNASASSAGASGRAHGAGEPNPDPGDPRGNPALEAVGAGASGPGLQSPSNQAAGDFAKKEKDVKRVHVSRVQFVGKSEHRLIVEKPAVQTPAEMPEQPG